MQWKKHQPTNRTSKTNPGSKPVEIIGGFRWEKQEMLKKKKKIHEAEQLEPCTIMHPSRGHIRVESCYLSHDIMTKPQQVSDRNTHAFSWCCSFRDPPVPPFPVTRWSPEALQLVGSCKPKNAHRWRFRRLRLASEPAPSSGARGLAGANGSEGREARQI